MDQTRISDGGDSPNDSFLHTEVHENKAETMLTRRDYMHGIGLLLIVVFLWTSSNFITQDLFEDGYDKPFLVTYLNTSAFGLYLLPWTVRWFLRSKLSGNDGERIRQGYHAIAVVEPLEAPTASIRTSFRAPSTFSGTLRRCDELEPLTTKDTAKLASVFCLFWFVANWSVNASLKFTSVASSTILSSTSGFFTLLVGRVFHVESLTLAKLGAVATSFAGVILVSLSDSTASPVGGPSAPTTNANLAPSGHLDFTDAVLGDGLALLSAVFYALYVILLKIRIKEESRIDMQLFFGFVGIFNVLMLWPFGVILHFTGVEKMELPHTNRAWTAVLVNMLITWSSDYIYVLAMLKTTPLVVTVGLSLTIPFAIVGDFFLNIPTAPIAILGAILVLMAFVAIGIENSRTEGTTKSDDIRGTSIEVERVSDDAGI